ncbi:MAG: autotransporter-associated beta strand repeat-containing protein, partial [Chthoniobacterales bacterium]
GGTNTVAGTAGGGPGTLTVGSVGGLNFQGTGSPNITVDSDNGTAGKIVLAGDVTVDSGVTAASISNGGALANPGQLDLNNSARGFTVDNSGGSGLTVSTQVINGGLTKAGAGVLTFSGANTYTGQTVINAGTLKVDNDGSSTFRPYHRQQCG